MTSTTPQNSSYVDSRYSTFYNVGRDVIFVSSDSRTGRADSGALNLLTISSSIHRGVSVADPERIYYYQSSATIEMMEEIQTILFTVTQNLFFWIHPTYLTAAAT
jgi:hypothetical protein